MLTDSRLMDLMLRISVVIQVCSSAEEENDGGGYGASESGQVLGNPDLLQGWKYQHTK